MSEANPVSELPKVALCYRDPTIALVLQGGLKKIGVREESILFCKNSEDLIEAIRGGIDNVICGLLLPGKSGVDIAREIDSLIKETGRKISQLIISNSHSGAELCEVFNKDDMQSPAIMGYDSMRRGIPLGDDLREVLVDKLSDFAEAHGIKIPETQAAA